MNRRDCLSAIGVGGVLGLAGCVGSALPGKGDSRAETTVLAGSETELDLPETPESDVDGPRLVVIYNADPAQRSHDAAVTITETRTDATLFDERVHFEEATDEQPTRLIVRLSEPGEYDVTVAFEDESEASETIAVTADELADRRKTITAFRLEDELVVETLVQQSGG